MVAVDLVVVAVVVVMVVDDSGGLRKPDPYRKSAAGSNNWWTPIFGWSSEPDYIQSTDTSYYGFENETGKSRSEKLFRGGFTAEKAKELRKKTIETSTFHDLMYHSAIASRLASEVSDR
ncbi:Hypothetical predicted protein [Olea europaea subsp. europaea]|uniref:Uncharacterized protein n=1 Tax=Olea europaea subsp. europaea TaxID=158383 RepID=A0A8S0V8L7_OLEEU|nr:Hypothetical predicted protein [Olea europaea subsp. europaea]